jgi:fluoride exporter
MTPTAILGGRTLSATGRFFIALEHEDKATMGYLIVFLGGGIGAALRHGINLAVARMLGTAFPYGTLLINISGSFIMGLIAAYFAFKGDASQHWRLFLTTGILGGFTTFSAFSLDVALLYERGETGLAALYVLASVAVSIGALFAGLALVRNFT